MPFSDDCWPASSKKRGGFLGSPERIDLVELGPGRGLFAQDVLGWSENKFPDFFRALRYVLVEKSLALREANRSEVGGINSILEKLR